MALFAGDVGGAGGDGGDALCAALYDGGMRCMLLCMLETLEVRRGRR